MKSAFACIVLALAGSACATNFTGSAHVDGGAQGCSAKCSAQGMDVAGMVFMGEYTSGCVCAARGKTASSRTDLLAAAAGGAGGSSAGVMMQTQRQQQQQR